MQVCNLYCIIHTCKCAYFKNRNMFYNFLKLLRDIVMRAEIVYRFSLKKLKLKKKLGNILKIYQQRFVLSVRTTIFNEMYSVVDKSLFSA